MRILPTRNIFLDSNIFEENNFFHSNDIQSIFYYSNIEVINLFMTSISKMELIDRMQNRVIDAKKEHNKLVSFINKTRIFRNLNTYDKFEKPIIRVEETIEELSSKLNHIINSSNIKIIKADSVSIEEVFELYYKQAPPFSKGKKYEFPDAFIIKSIDSWCKLEKKKMLFVTRDLDFLNYKSTHIIFKNNLSNLLDSISNYYDLIQENQIIPFIESSLKENQTDIIQLINSEINSLISFDLDFEKVSDIKSEKVKFINYKISSIRSKYAVITYNVELEISFTIFPTKFDFEASIFDGHISPKKFKYKKTIPSELEVSLKSKNDIKLKWINSNQKIFISMED